MRPLRARPLQLSESDRRFDVERVLAEVRLLTAVFYGVAAVVRPGDDEVATAAIGVAFAGFAVFVSWWLWGGRPPPSPLAHFVICGLDTGFFFLVLANNRADPNDSIHLIGMLIVFEGALRWAVVGGFALGAVIAGAVAWWTIDIGTESPDEVITFRVGVLVLIGIGVGAIVQSLQDQVSAFRLAFDASSDGMVVVGADRLIFDANDAMGALLGVAPDVLRGMSFADLVGADAPDDVSPGERVRYQRPDGSAGFIEVTVSPLPRKNLTYLVCRDVTDAYEAERRLERAASTDEITGLPNRRRFESDLELLLAEPADPPVILLFIDLDGFKDVNDTFGHLVGDALLRVVAGRLRDRVRDGDLIGRFGGDEFCVALRDTCRDEAGRIIDRFIDSVGQVMHVDHVTTAVGCSVGAAVHRPGESPTGLIRRADSAMYEAKRAGGNRGVYAVES